MVVSYFVWFKTRSGILKRDRNITYVITNCTLCIILIRYLYLAQNWIRYLVNYREGHIRKYLSTLRNTKLDSVDQCTTRMRHAQQSIIWWLEQAVKITRVIPLAIKSTTLIGINCWFENNSMVFIFHFITFFEYEISKLSTNILVALILF